MRRERPSPSGDSGAPARGASECAPKARRRERGAPDPPLRVLAGNFPTSKARPPLWGPGGESPEHSSWNRPPPQSPEHSPGNRPPLVKPGAPLMEPAPPPEARSTVRRSPPGAPTRCGAVRRPSPGAPTRCGAVRRSPPGAPTRPHRVPSGRPTGCPPGAPPDAPLSFGACVRAGSGGGTRPRGVPKLYPSSSPWPCLIRVRQSPPGTRLVSSLGTPPD